MYPTRRGWAVAALAVVLAVLAAVFARPLALVGAALVGAWLLAHQYRFTADLERTAASLAIEQAPARTGVRTGEDMPVTLVATRGADTALSLEIEAGLPVAAVAADRLAVTLEPDRDRADRTAAVEWPVTGRHRFAAPTVTATDGLFRETLTVGPRPAVTVEPPSPRSIHVGEGGDPAGASSGVHDSGRSGSGIAPTELREYVPGDTASEIDWKATARHDTPYVREYEAETDRQTLLVVDHRAALSTGRRGETKLETLRAVALAVAGGARRLGDPLGLVTVGDDGITDASMPGSSPADYGSVRRRLLDLEPTTAGDAPSPTAVSGRADPAGASGTDPTDAVPSGRGHTGVPRRTSPADVQRSLSDLEGDDDAFARTLRPFYADRQGCRQRVAEDPLYAGVQRGLTDVRGSVWAVVCTDDSRPAELRETVRLARRGGNEVLVLLAPSVLYEPGGLADIERAYDRYVAFEEFRRELARTDGVTALEVGPADRLATVLEAGRRGGPA
ncbi:DUF58 domain-containing protein [Natrinema thermotolerans]|uniref:DUF58 domain-containing protein n=1 Tax=Natrinema thermotolerans TaxID=121872 RepID=A0AAF0SZB7_9EURY|nr:DUF58 domain-containing protein [Natrinema thermotolerans]QCC60465.1 DUF58 domain-containing protein [Natrinema thermotolerans]WMT07499.1 DUF58 domain-containing protein [Natrinema thermotolerans]WMT08131.1 DUF58 domain-containing protein [Natrinema thermotolerans]